MKFLKTGNTFRNTYVNFNSEIIPIIYENLIGHHPFLRVGYLKDNVKKIKILLNIKKGITTTEKKNSLKRDKNNTLMQQYFNIMVGNGDKGTLFKHFNKAVENFFYILNDQNEEFFKYKNYLPLFYLSNHFIEYNDFNFILKEFLPKYFSLFDIKTKKTTKRMKSSKKYTHEVVYIPEPKRLKNTLKVINVYSENFKNYDLWERLFWMFLSIIMDKKRSYLINRRSYIYKKSLKFFVNKKNK